MDRKTYSFRANKYIRGHFLAMTSIIALLVGCSSLVQAESYAELPWGYDGAAGRCVVCHSLEKDGPFRVAPNLWGIVGAEKARDRSWYSYSPALIEKGGDWSVDELDEYLANASQFVPGTTKSIKVQDPGERQEIIDYLNQLDD